MHRRRVAALVATPVAVLIGLATYSASAADAPAPAPKTPTAVSATCNAPSRDKVLTVQEGIEIFKHCTATKSAAAAAGWHWMGNYGSVYDVTSVANSAGIGPGALIATPALGTNLVPAFMYY